MRRLTIEQLEVLLAMRVSGWQSPREIAEACERYYQAEWASSRLAGLVRRGFVERGERGQYRITAAGVATVGNE
jgi:predicted transcriptional regulator